MFPALYDNLSKTLFDLQVCFIRNATLYSLQFVSVTKRREDMFLLFYKVR